MSRLIGHICNRDMNCLMIFYFIFLNVGWYIKNSYIDNIENNFVENKKVFYLNIYS
jgi:Zn-dependent protease with chaperone function